MAKPKHAHNTVHHVHPPRPCFPSPALLSALALLATTPSAVAAGPLPRPTHPPDFLCPFVPRDALDPSSQPDRCQVVADKYVRGSDSLWRKTSTWTLFGSTCGSHTVATTSAIQSQPASSQPAPSAVEFDTSVLPAGWESVSTSSSGTEPSIILALAIILAGSICVFMTACVIWRRRKKRARDIERKLGQRRAADNDPQPNGCDQLARGKMRTWAKATARWKANIRQSARRRRKRHVSSSANRPPSPTSPQLSAIALSAPSRRGSIATDEPDPSRPEIAPPLDSDPIDSPPVLHDPPRSPSPPTYGASFDPRFSRLPPTSAVPKPGPIPLHVGPHCSQPPFIDDEPLPYIPPSDGHVAIDDKSRLAHIRALASSPPAIIDAACAGTIPPVSAPDWHEVEDDLEALGVDLGQVPTSSHHFGFPPPFPPPPARVDVPLPFASPDGHPLRYEDDDDDDDILISLPVPAPSEPSLGALPSAPPIDDPGLGPSAPCLDGDDELFQDWDESSSYVPENPPSADLDPTPACATELSISLTRASTPDSTTRDGILPRYHP